MMQTKKPALSWQRVLGTIPAALFLCYLVVTLALTHPGTVAQTLRETEPTFAGFRALTSEFESVLQEHVFGRNRYLDLNGLMARTLGISNLNERVRLPNGYLAKQIHDMDPEEPAAALAELKEFLEERDIGFLYVLAPSVAACYDVEFPPGYEAEAYKTIDAMMDALKEAGVQALDMDAAYEAMGWGVEEIFFRTDHHWLPQAALAAARCTMETLQELGWADYREEWLREDSWDVTVWEDLLLGSHARRTGALFAGLDDLPVFTPKFPVDYTFTGLNYITDNGVWFYRHDLLDMHYTEITDPYQNNPYNIYMYGDYHLRITTNAQGWNHQRVLLMGDSFKSPYEYFLTTQFRQVYTVDLRYYTDATLAQLVAQVQPDLVLMCTYSDFVEQKPMYTFGVEAYRAALEQGVGQVWELGDVSLEAGAQTEYYRVLWEDLTPGQTYTLTVDSLTAQGSREHRIQAALQAQTGEQPVCSHYFEAGSQETQRWIFTVPEDAQGDYAICLYAGTRGFTANIAAQLRNVRLYEGIAEAG